MNEQFAALEERKRTKALCVVAVVAVLIATLWPFNPSPRNGVIWLHGTTGLKFEKAGLAVSRGPLRLADTEAESYSALCGRVGSGGREESLLPPSPSRPSHGDDRTSMTRRTQLVVFAFLCGVSIMLWWHGLGLSGHALWRGMSRRA